jgi:hypothetical protein
MYPAQHVAKDVNTCRPRRRTTASCAGCVVVGAKRSAEFDMHGAIPLENPFFRLEGIEREYKETNTNTKTKDKTKTCDTGQDMLVTQVANMSPLLL